MIYVIKTVSSGTHCGLGARAALPAGGALRDVDLQVAVGRGEPAGPLFLLLLGQELHGAGQHQAGVAIGDAAAERVQGQGGHGGRDLNVVLGRRLLPHDGVAVGVAGSIPLGGSERERHSLF